TCRRDRGTGPRPRPGRGGRGSGRRGSRCRRSRLGGVGGARRVGVRRPFGGGPGGGRCGRGCRRLGCGLRDGGFLDRGGAQVAYGRIGGGCRGVGPVCPGAPALVGVPVTRGLIQTSGRVRQAEGRGGQIVHNRRRLITV